MIEAMDHHIGRLIGYLEEKDLYDDTVFVFVSDNGSEGSDVFSASGSGGFELWLSLNGYDTDYETLGTRGSFMNIGPSFASAAAAPLAYYKFFAHEGGMRVPLIIAGPPVREKGSISHAFAYVTDLAATTLDIAGVAPHAGEYEGRSVEPMTGRSLVPIIEADIGSVYEPEDHVGYELAGNAALFRGDFKLVKDRGPVGDDEWHLYNIVTDPGETHDLRSKRSERFEAMLANYQSYVEENNVLPVPEGYDQRVQVFRNGLRARLGASPRIAGAVVVLVVGFFAWRWISKRRGGSSATAP
jgi:arylsulfatase/uncharacterized sulfatase